MGLFDWLLGRRPTKLDSLLAAQERMLGCEEHWRAFSPDPSSDVYPLKVGGSNEVVFERIRSNGILLRRVLDGCQCSVLDFAGGFLVFTAEWDAYSAAALGKLKGRVDAGAVPDPWGVVLVSYNEDGLAERKSNSWYWERLHVLDSEYAGLIEHVGGVPFRIDWDSTGKVARVSEGVYCTREPGAETGKT